jgi:hypothetical protein
MPMKSITPSNTAASVNVRHLGRRAFVGFGILTIMTLASGALMYSSIEPGEAFASDADAARRNSLLSSVTSWSMTASLDAWRDTTPRPDALAIIEGEVLAKLDAAVALQLIEARERGQDTVRPPVVVALTMSQSAQLDGLLARGVEGVFLDARSALQAAQAGGNRAISDLAGKIVALANQARLFNPNFVLVLRNAAELSADFRIARAIDGVAHDNLLYGLDGPAVANSANEIAVALHDLNRVKRSGRPVFIAESLARDALPARTEARNKLASFGFIGWIAEPGTRS